LAKLPYIKWFPADYLSDHKTATLTLEEDGIYHRILWLIWSQSPGWYMNTSLPELAKNLRIRTDKAKRLLCSVAVKLEGSLLVGNAAEIQLKSELTRKELENIFSYSGLNLSYLKDKLDFDALVLASKRLHREAISAEKYVNTQEENGRKGGRPKKPTGFDDKSQAQSQSEAEAIKKNSSSSCSEPTLFGSELDNDSSPSPGQSQTHRDTGKTPKSPVVMEVPLVKRDGVFKITRDDVAQWQETFQGIDVLAELRAVRQWNLDNPQNRKTRSGFRRHVSKWLGKAQNRAPRAPGNGKENPYEGIGRKTA